MTRPVTNAEFLVRAAASAVAARRVAATFAEPRYLWHWAAPTSSAPRRCRSTARRCAQRPGLAMHCYSARQPAFYGSAGALGHPAARYRRRQQRRDRRRSSDHPTGKRAYTLAPSGLTPLGSTLRSNGIQTSQRPSMASALVRPAATAAGWPAAAARRAGDRARPAHRRDRAPRCRASGWSSGEVQTARWLPRSRPVCFVQRADPARHVAQRRPHRAAHRRRLAQQPLVRLAVEHVGIAQAVQRQVARHAAGRRRGHSAGPTGCRAP